MRKVLNSQVYSFELERDRDADDIARVLNLFQITLGSMDLTVEPREAKGTHVAGGPLPSGLVYEDIMEVLMRLFRLSYMKSRGLDQFAKPDSSLTAAEIQHCKDLMKSIIQ